MAMKRVQRYDGSKSSRGEELDGRFGMLAVRMRRGVEAYQTNDHATSKKVEAELNAEILSLDINVQRQIAAYIRGLALEGLVPVTTLHYAGPIGRSHYRLVKIALQAKILGAEVNSYRFRDTIVGLPETLDAMAKNFANQGLFERAKQAKALKSQVREYAPRAWFEPKEVGVTVASAEKPAPELAPAPVAPTTPAAEPAPEPAPTPEPAAPATPTADIFSDLSDAEKSDRGDGLQEQARAAAKAKTRRPKKPKPLVGGSRRKK